MPSRVISLLAPSYQPSLVTGKHSKHQAARTREVFAPILIISFPLSEAVGVFVPF